MKKINNLYSDIYSFFVKKKNINKRSTEIIFSKLRVDTTFQTTTYNRLKDLNKKLKYYKKKLFPKKNILICDFGVSSGQSTLELHNDLNNKKIKHIYGFDKQIYLKIYRVKKIIFLYSLDNNLLMVEYDKHILRYRYFLIFKKLEKFFLYLFYFMNIKYVKSNILTPNLDTKEKCKFFEQDIFNIKKKYYNLFDVVRVSNLLNFSYFTKAKLKIAISNINKISKENCIILISRTTSKKKNLGSIFRKKNGKFELIEDVNGGSELKDLMLSLNKIKSLKK